MKGIRLLTLALLCMMILQVYPGSDRALAYGTATNWQAQDFATGFVTNNAVNGTGPIGLTFSPYTNNNSTLYVGDIIQNQIYTFPMRGSWPYTPGSPIDSTPVSNRYKSLNGLTFGPDGKLYAALQWDVPPGHAPWEVGAVVELDPVTGAFKRWVAYVPGATGLAVNPVDGNIYVSDNEDSEIYQVSNYTNADMSVLTGPQATVTPWESIGYPDGMTFDPAGNLYVASENAGSLGSGGAFEFPWTGSKNGPRTYLGNVAEPDGIALSLNTANPSKPGFVFVNQNSGSITEINLSTLGQTLIFTGGTRGDFTTVGPDGCLYATQSSEVVKITGADLSCDFLPTPPLPPVIQGPKPAKLTYTGTSSPSGGAPNPNGGGEYADTVTVNGNLSDASNNPIAGQSVTFTLHGSSSASDTCTATTDASGNAHCSITPTLDRPASGTIDLSLNGSSYSASPVSAPFLIALEETTTVMMNDSTTANSAANPVVLTPGKATTLYGRLSSEVVSDSDGDTGTGAPLGGKTLTLSIMNGSTAAVQCTGTTDSTGTASCQVTAPGYFPNPSLLASFNPSSPDPNYKNSSGPGFAKWSTLPTKLTVGTCQGNGCTPASGTTATCTGTTCTAPTAAPGQQDFNDTVTLWAKLVDSADNPVSGSPVTLTMGNQGCPAGTVTDSNGVVSCSITISQPAGSYQVTANFAGTGQYLPSGPASVPFTVTLEETQIHYTGPTVWAQSNPLPLSARLLDGAPPVDTGAPLLDGGRTVTLSIAAYPAGNPVSCSGTTDSSGNVSCTIQPSALANVPLGPVMSNASFGTDPKNEYKPVAASANGTLFAWPGNGNFTIGDTTFAQYGSSGDGGLTGHIYNFWGMQWDDNNVLSAAPNHEGPDQFKGFIDTPSNPWCGTTWTTRPGNSSDPPATIPTYVGIVVPTTVTHNGSVQTGDVYKIVVIKAKPGYMDDPGLPHNGLGPVVATYCDSTGASAPKTYPTSP